MASLWAELTRRNVPRVGAAYAIGAWLVIEVSSVVLPAFDAVNSIVTWARATGRSAEDAEEMGAAFVQYATTGQRQDLDSATLSRMEFGLEDLAQVYAFVGDRERTLAALQDGYEQHAGSRSVLSMKINPGYDFIRSDSRFIELEMLSGLRDRF